MRYQDFNLHLSFKTIANAKSHNFTFNTEWIHIFCWSKIMFLLGLGSHNLFYKIRINANYSYELKCEISEATKHSISSISGSPLKTCAFNTRDKKGAHKIVDSSIDKTELGFCSKCFQNFVVLCSWHFSG